MRVFVTGATGFVGFAISQELKAAGHEVLGLARSDAAVARLTQVGISVHRGAREDLESLRIGVSAADAVIHTAFTVEKYAESAETERRALEAMGAALEDSDTPLVVTSGVAFLSPERALLQPLCG
jgi:nucleoside-diphosphate-sugar epimerase